MLVIQLEKNKIVGIEKYAGQKLMPDEVLVSDSDIQVMYLKNKNKRYVDTDYLREVLEKVFEVRCNLNKTRRHENTTARFTGMYILYKLNYGSLSKIGNIFERCEVYFLKKRRIK